MSKIPKIVTVVGARPQFIKAAVVSPELASFSNEIVIHTGQHFDFDMSEVFFNELNIAAPTHQLNIHSLNHGEMTGRMLIEIEKILLKEKPDLVLVYGDTNSTLAGALSAAKLNIPIAHVEAGLRSYNRNMPEEMNRLITDQLSTLFFLPSQAALENLKKEGYDQHHKYIVGDVMYDLALKVAAELKANLNEKNSDYILLTLHRAENLLSKAQLEFWMELITTISNIKKVIWILHPRTMKALSEHHFQLPEHERLEILQPLGYKALAQYVLNASHIATDSGGLQKEAFYHRKPCITLRTETEWTELSTLGWNLVLGKETISKSVEKIRAFIQKDFSTVSHPPVYGEGNAGYKIAMEIKKFLR